MDTPSQTDAQERAIVAPDALEQKISDLLDILFRRRIDRLQELKLGDRLRSKNPYLLRAIGVADAREIVQALLDAHISSSDETIFGNEFFEPLAKWVATKSFEGSSSTSVQVSGSKGVDIQLSGHSDNQAIAIKSGPKVFNAQSRQKQIDEFKTVERILKKDRKHFQAIVGYCYGRKKQNETGYFTEMAGQQLWEHLTGEHDFYLRIIRLMQSKPIQHRPQFIKAYDEAKERFVREFNEKYALSDGSIDWDKLVIEVSAIGAPKKAPKAAKAKSKAKGNKPLHPVAQ